ncbi:MAG: T9SS type A sorting domain-containing protein, partial [Ignavibacteria bacterium]|nr:T9SS type A sorting domain-containing protein [Ignavibacteria bacterium]
ETGLYVLFFCVPTAVGGSIELPIEIAVSSNYPNPFNPTTTINYELPAASVVRLAIYNVLGQKVRTLVDEAMDAGSHKAIWDGRNDVGLPVVSGTYIYRFEAGGFVRTRKMVLVK